VLEKLKEAGLIVTNRKEKIRINCILIDKEVRSIADTKIVSI